MCRSGWKNHRECKRLQRLWGRGLAEKVGILFFVLLLVGYAAGAQEQSLWDLAKAKRDVLTISTLFTSHQVRDYLGSESGTVDAIEWCRKTGVTHVFIESFRGNYMAERKTLEAARDRFGAEGFAVSGCVTPTKVGKQSTGWNIISCYTDQRSQEHMEEIFEFTASIFDEIMIDDFLFTDCECEHCKKARGGQSWAEYRCDLMVEMGRERILGAARRVNPDVTLIIKYPQWYDNFHNRGYEVIRQTADYDRIWVGTETRDFDNPRWGGKVQYEAYYIMRWLGEIGGGKTGGGWFDPYGTTEDTYVEQARQTVLADAKEMLLFCYGSLLRETGPANVEKLRAEIPELFELAGIVRGKRVVGIAAPKPPNSDAHDERYIFDFVGMLGLPLVPTATIDPDAKAAFFAVHALKDPGFRGKLTTMLDAGRPVLISDGLAKRLDEKLSRHANVTILRAGGDPKNLLKLTRDDLQPIREKMLEPFGMTFDAPNKVALYVFGGRHVIVENFNDRVVDVGLGLPREGEAEITLVLPDEGRAKLAKGGRKLRLKDITPRTLVVIEY